VGVKEVQRVDIALSSSHGGFNYPLFFGWATDQHYASLAIPETTDSVFVIADGSVDALHGAALMALLPDRWPRHRIAIPSGESSKSLASLEYLLSRLIELGATRRSFILSFGGGMIGNLAGLAASILYRGVAFAHLPTTLLAGSDSVISLKQAVNGRWAKNTFGCYAPPKFAFFDFRWLHTLPPEEIRAGLCEAAKNVLAIRPASIPRLRAALTDGVDRLKDLPWIVEDSVGAKLEVMAHDAAEQQAGLVLEYGHMVGHAVELADRRARGRDGLTHGEAVAVGMIAEASIANALGLLSDAVLGLHRELIESIGSPTALPSHLDRDEVLARITKDNKRGYIAGLGPDHAAMVLLEELGKPVMTGGVPLAVVPLNLVKDALERLQTGPRRGGTASKAKTGPAITVVVITTGDRETLLECVASVFRQDYAPIELVVIVDGDRPIPPFGDPPVTCSVRTVQIPRARRVRGRAQTYKHFAWLRNVALELVRTPSVAFLDDDNVWSPDHLSSLARAAAGPGVIAAHCWRRVVGSDGRPAQLLKFPWLPAGTPAERDAYNECVRGGVFADAGSVIRDSVTAAVGAQVGLVDMGAWLFKREALAGYRFPETYSDEDLAYGVGEDDRLLQYLRGCEGTIVCTQRPTLTYRLGGFSNGADLAETRARNAVLSRLDVRERRTAVQAMPRFVVLELNRYCNLSCGMCREPGQIDKSQRMSDGIFDRVASEILPFAEIVDMRGWGESLILPEFPDRLARMAGMGAQTRVISNLSFRRDAVLAMLAEVGTHMGVSLDAADPAILGELRRGANASLIFRNLRLLCEEYGKRGIIDRLVIYCTVQKPALHDLRHLLERVAEIGGRDIRLAPVTGCDHLPIALNGSEKLIRAVLDDLGARAEQLGVTVSLVARLPGDDALPAMPSPCLHPWTHCYVTWDGRLGFCDHLIGPAGDPYILGSLTDGTFHDTWNGPAWRALRGEHLGERRSDAPHFFECSWCYANRHLDCEDLLEPELASRRRFVTCPSSQFVPEPP
jgi:3-dehydroquinate synthetase/MoaA/NifB/PqqE/SkfB family radical SAM enzyme